MVIFKNSIEMWNTSGIIFKEEKYAASWICLVVQATLDF